MIINLSDNLIEKTMICDNWQRQTLQYMYTIYVLSILTVIYTSKMYVEF